MSVSITQLLTTRVTFTNTGVKFALIERKNGVEVWEWGAAMGFSVRWLTLHAFVIRSGLGSFEHYVDQKERRRAAHD